MKNNQTEEIQPGNNILNGIERWVPDGTKRPKQFEYEGVSHIWYKNKHEESACLSRAGVPEDKWVSVPIPLKFA